MRDMDRHEREALDRHITGNYGEDQFDFHDADGIDGFSQCQVSECDNKSVDGVLCAGHLAQMEAWAESSDEETEE